MSSVLTVAEVVGTQARLQPDKVTVHDSHRALSFQDWDSRATRLANALRVLGLETGDRVALLAYNCVEWLELYVALARAGLVAVPIDFRLVGAEIQYIAKHCEARAFVVQEDLLEQVLTIRDELDIPTERFVHFGGEDRTARVVGVRDAHRAWLVECSGGRSAAGGHLGVDVHLRYDRQAERQRSATMRPQRSCRLSLRWTWGFTARTPRYS